MDPSETTSESILALMPVLLSSLRTTGIACCEQPVSLADYRAYCAQLGELVSERKIAMTGAARRYFTCPDPIPPHADGDVELVAWWCEHEDLDGPESVLVDVAALITELDAAERETLRVIHSQVRGSSRHAEELPVISARGMYWGLWGAVDATLRSDEHHRVAQRFAELVAEHHRDRAHRFIARAGQFYVVDNKRILHGRDRMAPDSPRTLVRLWIRAPGLVPVHPNFLA